MKPLASSYLLLPLLLAACATGVTQDLPQEEVTEGGAAGSTYGGAPVIPAGGKASGTAGTGGNPGSTAFGGSASTAGSAGKASGGAAGAAGSAGASHAGTGGSLPTAGSGGTTSGGTTTGGTGTGGKAGCSSGGAAGAAGTAGAAGSVATGSCTGTAAFVLGAGNKYAVGAKVVATCKGGTPCTLAKPAAETGKSYEFSCTDMYNCGTQDPATTNWSTPPWQLSKACE
jgi:hypothetical protein